MIKNWTLRKRPMCMERRVDFDNYDSTRDFLDMTSELSEKEGFYPDVNFSRTHVSMTIHLEEGVNEFTKPQKQFAEQVNLFAPTNKITNSLETDYVVEGRQ